MIIDHCHHQCRALSLSSPRINVITSSQALSNIIRRDYQSHLSVATVIDLCHHHGSLSSSKGYQTSSGVIVNITCQWQLFEVADFLSWCHHPPWRCFQVFWLWFKLNQSKQCQSGGPSLATHISFPLDPHLPEFFATHLFTSSPHESKQTPHYPGRNVDNNKKLVT